MGIDLGTTNSVIATVEGGDPTVIPNAAGQRSTPSRRSENGEDMTVKLNARAFGHAQDLIVTGAYVIDDRDAWSEHQPSAQQENDFIRQRGIGEYARWYLGIDDLHGMLEALRRTA